MSLRSSKMLFMLVRTNHKRPGTICCCFVSRCMCICTLTSIFQILVCGDALLMRPALHTLVAGPLQPGSLPGQRCDEGLCPDAGMRGRSASSWGAVHHQFDTRAQARLINPPVIVHAGMRMVTSCLVLTDGVSVPVLCCSPTIRRCCRLQASTTRV